MANQEIEKLREQASNVFMMKYKFIELVKQEQSKMEQENNFANSVEYIQDDVVDAASSDLDPIATVSSPPTSPNLFDQELDDEDRQVINKVQETNHASLNGEEQSRLYKIVNRFIDFWLENHDTSAIKRGQITILEDPEVDTFFCSLLVENADPSVTFRIRMYSPIPKNGTASETVKDDLDKFFENEIKRVFEKQNRTDVVKARKRFNYGEAQCKKTDHTPKECDCNCIYACVYGLMLINGQDPLHNFESLEWCRHFLRSTLLNGTLPRIDSSFIVANETMEEWAMAQNMILQGNIQTPENQQFIVDILNKCSEKIKIMPDSKHGCYVVVRLGKERRNKKYIEIYSPVSKTENPGELDENDKIAIDMVFQDWFSGKEKARHFARPIKDHIEAKYAVNRFVYTLGYVLSLGLGLPVGAFMVQYNIEEEEANNEAIRVVIAQMLERVVVNQAQAPV